MIMSANGTATIKVSHTAATTISITGLEPAARLQVTRVEPNCWRQRCDHLHVEIKGIDRCLYGHLHRRLWLEDRSRHRVALIQTKKRTQMKVKGNNNKKGERGFTLVETSISMVVMMVAGLAISSLFVFSMQNNVGGNERALAMAVAQQQLEQLRSVTFEDTTMTVGTTTTTISNGDKNYSVVKDHHR